MQKFFFEGKHYYLIKFYKNNFIYLVHNFLFINWNEDFFLSGWELFHDKIEGPKYSFGVGAIFHALRYQKNKI